MEKYDQENKKSFWQIFWIVADEQAHISLTGQNDTEASAKTVVFRQA